jgi:hypothetical protein
MSKEGKRKWLPETLIIFFRGKNKTIDVNQRNHCLAVNLFFQNENTKETFKVFFFFSANQQLEFFSANVLQRLFLSRSLSWQIDLEKSFFATTKSMMGPPVSVQSENNTIYHRNKNDLGHPLPPLGGSHSHSLALALPHTHTHAHSIFLFLPLPLSLLLSLTESFAKKSLY